MVARPAQREPVDPHDPALVVDLGAAALDQLGRRPSGPARRSGDEVLGPGRPIIPERGETGGGDVQSEIAQPVIEEPAHAWHCARTMAAMSSATPGAPSSRPSVR